MSFTIDELTINWVNAVPNSKNLLSYSGTKTPVKLYKYCKPQYNPLKGECRTLRLGSTKAFRKRYDGEGDMINDRKEGLVTFHDEQDNINFRDGKLHPDSFIFCTSTRKFNQIEVDKIFGPEYTSCYCIPNSLAFMDALGYYVRLAIGERFSQLYHPSTYDFIENFLRQNGTGKFEFSIIPFHDTVKYGKDEFVKIHDKRDVLSLSIISHLTKPIEYAFQNEYRMFFISWFQPIDAYFDIAETDLQVNFENILDFIEPCE